MNCSNHGLSAWSAISINIGYHIKQLPPESCNKYLEKSITCQRMHFKARQVAL